MRLHTLDYMTLRLCNCVCRAEWYAECKGMADRIKEMRSKLRGGLEARGSQRKYVLAFFGSHNIE